MQILGNFRDAHNKKSSHSLRSLGRIHAGRLRHYAPHACAPYLKVSCLQEILAFGVKLEECE